MTFSALTSLMEFLAGAMLLFSFFLLARMRLRSMLYLFIGQSISLALYAYLSAVTSGESHLVTSALLTLAIKAVFIPWLLVLIAKRTKASHRLSSYVRPSPTLFLGAIMVMVAFLLSRTLLSVTGTSETFILFVSIAMLLHGFLMLTLRKDMYGQIIGFLVMENGIFTFGLVLTGGMPFIVEIGIFFDVMIGSVLMAALSYRVQREHDTVSTEQLSELLY